MKAVLCPVCNGSGRLPPQHDSSDYYETPCHGCAEWGSKGWLLAAELEDGVLPTSYDTDDGYKERMSNPTT